MKAKNIILTIVNILIYALAIVLLAYPVVNAFALTAEAKKAAWLWIVPIALVVSGAGYYIGLKIFLNTTSLPQIMKIRRREQGWTPECAEIIAKKISKMHSGTAEYYRYMHILIGIYFWLDNLPEVKRAIDYIEAHRVFNLTVKTEKRDWIGYNGVCMAYCERVKDEKGAIERYNMMAGYLPEFENDPQARMMVAAARSDYYCLTGDYETAMKYLNTIKPNDEIEGLTLSIDAIDIYIKAGRLDDAQKLLDEKLPFIKNMYMKKKYDERLQKITEKRNESVQ